MGTMGAGLPFPAMVAATLVWGLFGSVFINGSRTLYQEAAPPLHRGRVLSVYQLGFLGTAPLGSLATGFVSAGLGPLRTLQIAAVAMLVAVALIAARTGAARMD